MKKQTLIYTLVGVSGVILLLIFLVSRLFNPSQQRTIPSPNQTNPTSIPQETGLPPSIQNDIQIQLEADKKFSQLEKQRSDNYPWYDKLPLQTDKYFVYFDINQQKFIGDIYSASEGALIKNEVSQKLKDLGVDINKYPIEWTNQ